MKRLLIAAILAMALVLFESPSRFADAAVVSSLSLLDLTIVAVAVLSLVFIKGKWEWKGPAVLALAIGGVTAYHGAIGGNWAQLGFGYVDLVAPIILGGILGATLPRLLPFRVLLWGLVGAGSLMAAQAVFLATMPTSWSARLGLQVFWSSGASRGYSPIGGPNVTAAFIAMVVPIALYLATSDKRGIWSWLSLPSLFAGLLSTLTRGAWISALVGVVAWAACMRPKTNWKTNLVLLVASSLPGLLLISSPLMVKDAAAAAVAAKELSTSAPIPSSQPSEVVISPAMTRVGSTSADEFSVSDRLHSWKAALNLIKENPVAGTGPNTVMAVSYHDVKLSGRTLMHVHSTYLQLGLMLGLPVAIGMIAFGVWVLVRPLVRGTQVLAPETVALSISLVVAAANWTTDYFLWYPRYGVIFWTLFFIVYADGSRRIFTETE